CAPAGAQTATASMIAATLAAIFMAFSLVGGASRTRRPLIRTRRPSGCSSKGPRVGGQLKEGGGTMTSLREEFGRALRLGIIGGGPDAWIGRMHRGAAEMDGWWRAVAGVFSSDPARSRATGPAMGFGPERSYGTVEEMLAREKCREDGIEAVA